MAKQAAQDNDEIYESPPPSPRLNATWLEQRQIDVRRIWLFEKQFKMNITGKMTCLLKTFEL